MFYSEFVQWFEEIYDNDKTYVQNNQLYGFRLVFHKESIIWKSDALLPTIDGKFKQLYFKNKHTNELKKWLVKKHPELF